MKKLDSERWVILALNVRDLNLSGMSKRMMILSVSDWIEQLMCLAFKSARVLRWIRRSAKFVDESFVQVCMGVRSQRALMKNSISQRKFVSTCPVDYATSVPTEKVHYGMNLESVLGESLQHYGIKRHVPFTNRTGSTMNVNFVVTDTKRAILSVH